MTAQDHPPDVALLAFAAGTLNDAQQAEIAAHVGGCARCRAFVQTMEQVGGVVLDDLPPAPLAKGSLAQVLAQLDRPAAAYDRVAGADVPRRSVASGRSRGVLVDWRRIIPHRPVRVGLAAAALVMLALGTYLAADHAFIRYMDDYASSTATTGIVPIGGATAGKIERSGDADWFRVLLTQGVTYRFQLEGSDTDQGTLQYPMLRLLDEAGRVLHMDAGSVDGPGPGWTSVLAYNAPTTGTYYLSSEARGDDRGTYMVSVAAVSASQYNQ